jgi:hypothetical protein
MKNSSECQWMGVYEIPGTNFSIWLDYMKKIRLRLGPHERTKCVRYNVRCGVRCKNITKPMGPNIRGTRPFVDRCHNVHSFFMDEIMLERTSSLADWRHNFACPWMEQARGLQLTHLQGRTNLGIYVQFKKCGNFKNHCPVRAFYHEMMA